jgi:hypothetical protein
MSRINPRIGFALAAIFGVAVKVALVCFFGVQIGGLVGGLFQ